jgi:hypothetical protein
MNEQPTVTRRRALELSGVGAGLAVAGCMEQTDDGALADDERRATFPLPIDQEAIQAEIQTLQSELQAGNITQSEAQTQLEDRREELAAASRERALSEAQSLGLTIENDVEIASQQGIQLYVLVSGAATSLIDYVSTDAVNGLLPASVFEEIRAQQQAQQAQANGSANDSNTSG